jgi:hypothetical protein
LPAQVSFLAAKYSARDFPNLLDPIVLATLTNDVNRLAVMVRRDPYARVAQASAGVRAAEVVCLEVVCLRG